MCCSIQFFCLHISLVPWLVEHVPFPLCDLDKPCRVEFLSHSKVYIDTGITRNCPYVGNLCLHRTGGPVAKNQQPIKSSPLFQPSRSRRCLHRQGPRVRHPPPLQWAGAQLKRPSLGPCSTAFAFFFLPPGLIGSPRRTLPPPPLDVFRVLCVCVLIKTATCNSVLSESFTVKISPKPSRSAKHCLETISSAVELAHSTRALHACFVPIMAVHYLLQTSNSRDITGNG